LRNIMLYPRSGGRFGVLSYVRYRGEKNIRWWSNGVMSHCMDV